MKPVRVKIAEITESIAKLAAGHSTKCYESRLIMNSGQDGAAEERYDNKASGHRCFQSPRLPPNEWP